MQVIVGYGKNQISFTGRDYYFLSKTHDMLTEGNVMIDRAAHEGKRSILLNQYLIKYLIVYNYQLLSIYLFIYPSFSDLLRTKWIGLITNVVVTRIFELHIVRHICERILYIGDKEHTILFKYEICKIDHRGIIIKSVSFCINFTKREIPANINLFYFGRKRRKYVANGCQ